MTLRNQGTLVGCLAVLALLPITASATPAADAAGASREEVSMTRVWSEPGPRIPPGGPEITDPTRPRDETRELLVRYTAAAAGSPVEFASARSKRERARLNQSIGAVAVGQVPDSRIEVVKLRAGVGVEEALESYREDPAVAVAEPNHRYYLLDAPDDPHYNLQWPLENTGQTGGLADSDIDADEAWALPGESDPVVVVVIDSGIDATHPDLADNVWTNPGEVPGDNVDNDDNGYVDDVHGWDVVENDGDPNDLHGHGTHVAGTIAALTDNGEGVAGVAPGVQVAGCRMFDANGGAAADGGIRCLNYVRALRAAGVPVVATNNSWGGGAESALLRQAIDSMPDVPFVAAAGNLGQDHDRVTYFPASYPSSHIISVAATDHQDRLPYWSDRGSSTVSLGAPGVSIVSLRAAGTTLGGSPGAPVPPTDPDPRYISISGTSMAAPHVAGVVAMLKARDGSLSGPALKNLVLAGADQVPELDGATVTGARLNARGALECANREVLAPVGQPPTFPIQPGRTAVFSVLSIDCADPIGPVFARTSAGERFELRDDGVAPDLTLDDGVFSASFLPNESTNWVRFAAGTGTVVMPRLSVAGYLPQPQVGRAYDQRISVPGATEPVQWSVTAGSLPAGLRLSFDGVIWGTPTAAGSSDFRVRARDAAGRVAAATLTLTAADDGLVEDVLVRDVGEFSRVPLDNAQDGQGNVYVTGYYIDPATGLQNAFLSKFDRSGLPLWTRYFPRTRPWSMTWGFALVVDRDGHSFVASGSPAVRGDSDIVVSKFDPEGNAVWETAYPGERAEAPLSINLDPLGSLVVTGLARTPFQPDQAITVKLSSAGQVEWARLFSGQGDVDLGSAVDTDAAGNVFVAGRSGSFSDGITSYVPLLLKYSPDGELVWSNSWEPGARADFQIGNAIAVDDAGNSYVGLSFGERVLKFDSAGNRQWEAWMASPTEESVFVQDLAFDRFGDLVITGAYFGLTAGRWLYAVGELGSDGQAAPFRRLESDPFVESAVDVSVTEDNTWRVSLPSGDGLVLTSLRRALGVTPTRLPTPIRGVEYAHSLTATGGAPPYRWRVVAGALPPGLRLSARAGSISGRPTQAGIRYDVTVSVTGYGGESVLRRYRGRVGFVKIAPLFVGSQFIAGDPTEVPLTAVGTAGPFRWRVLEGALPDGLRLNRTTGVVSGTPRTEGRNVFTLEVIDAQGHVARRVHRWEVVEIFRITTALLPDANLGVPYSAQVESRGGVAPLTWALWHDQPPGLDIDPQTGVISGVPAEPGTYSVGVLVTAANGLDSSSRDIALTVRLQ